MRKIKRKIRVYIEEEQEILREAFRAVLPIIDPDIDLVKVSDTGVIAQGRTGELAEIFDLLSPSVVLLGVKTLPTEAVEALSLIHERYPSTGVIVLCAYYNRDTSRYIKGLLKSTSHRGAYLFKHSVNSIAEFGRLIHAVAEGRLIIDPQVFQVLMAETNLQSSASKSLTRGELEVLRWMAEGYKDAAEGYKDAAGGSPSLHTKVVEDPDNGSGTFAKLSDLFPDTRYQERPW